MYNTCIVPECKESVSTFPADLCDRCREKAGLLSMGELDRLKRDIEYLAIEMETDDRDGKMGYWVSAIRGILNNSKKGLDKS